MSEETTLARTAKIIQTNYDQSIATSDALFECSYCLTKGQVRAIMGMVEQWGWDTRWYSPSDEEISQVAIDKFSADLSWRLSMGCCGDGQDIVLQRLNPDTGMLEFSTDGGATWNTSGNDPRVGGIMQPPPITTGVSATKCDAATNAKNKILSIVLQMIAARATDASNSELGTIAATILAGIFGSPVIGAIVAIFGGVITLLIEADLETLTAAFDTTTATQLLCLLLANIEDDGSFSADGYAAVMSGLAAVTNTTAQSVLRGIIGGLHEEGLTNCSALGLSSGSVCSECECDLSLWGLLSNGSEVSRDEVSITIDGTLSGGFYYMDLSNHPTDWDSHTDYSEDCCRWTWEVNSGVLTETLYVPCGDNYADGLIGIGAQPTELANLLQFKSNVPFQVTVTLA